MVPESAPAYDAFVVAAPGVEELVSTELSRLGIVSHSVVDGGVEFKASRRQLYEANLHLRTASRVIVRLAEFKALTFADLERRARRVPWEKVLRKGEAVMLRVTCRKSRLYHSGAVAQRIARDLIERMDVRVSTTREDSEIESGDGAQLIIVRLDRDRCTISADSSGAHLHQRGYRISITQAPMRETLAAALVITSGWDRRSPLIDPFCGSGTIPIEAALMAARIAPGKQRDFRFMQWPDFDRAEWKKVRSDAAAHERSNSVGPIVGSDRTAAAIRAATENAERAGVQDIVRLERVDALRIEPGPQTGWIVSNPPYGVRLGDQAESRRLLSRFGDHIRSAFNRWHIGLLAPAQAQRLVGFPLESRVQTTNGGLRVAMFVGSVPSGSREAATPSAARP